jgi:TonB family protein
MAQRWKELARLPAVSMFATFLLSTIACGHEPARSPVTETPRVQVASTFPALVVRSRTSPTLPKAARRAHVRGPVILAVRVDETGKVEVLEVVRGHALLNDIASDAARHWLFEPYLFNGRPTPFFHTLIVQFKEP